MVHKDIEYTIKYLQNCNYEASELKNKCRLPQQNVDININMENISAKERVGYNSVTQIDYQNNNKIYYNDTLKVTVSINIMNIPTSIVNIGSLSINYLNENMEIENLFGADIPVSKTGEVIFTFKPHYNGYIQVVYHDDSNFFISNQKESQLIILNKIPINTYTIANPIFLEYKKETTLICNVIDVYGNKLNYGHVVFLGYHNIPRDSDNPSAGQEVVLGNPVPVINGIATLKYSPEQDIDIEYIVGHYNYRKEQYGNNFKYYEAHASHTSVSTIKENKINFTLGVLKDNNIVDTTIFDGFIHLTQEDTIRINTQLLDENNEIINIQNDMNFTLHIEGTKHIILKNYSNAKASNVDEWIKNNVVYEEYKDEISLQNSTIDINNIPPGYYNIYVTFKDTNNREDTNRIYYQDYTSDIKYVAISQPNITINPILSYGAYNDSHIYQAQVNDNISINLKATCENALDGMKGIFTINDIEYKAIYKNGAFIPEKTIKINKIGDYYVHFQTEASYYADTGYYPIQIATPILLQVRDILEPIIEIPQGYIDNQYPGSIKYILSVKNWYNETGINIEVKIKETETNTIIDYYTEIYKGDSIHKEINNLLPGIYQIEATINNKTTISEKHTISQTTLQGNLNELSGNNIVSGMQTNIEYDIVANKPVLSKSIINNAKMYARKGNKTITFNITQDNLVLNENNTILSIYYPVLLFLDGNWTIKVVQNENQNFDSDIFQPNDSKLNTFITESKTFEVGRTKGKINIDKDNDNININISNKNTNNNQILLLKIKISYGDYQQIDMVALTDRKNNVIIPLTDINIDFESLTIRQQIFNIKVTLDPYDNILDEINGLSIQKIKETIIAEYPDLYNDIYLDNFAQQIKEDMEYTALFSTYDKIIKSESYGN